MSIRHFLTLCSVNKTLSKRARSLGGRKVAQTLAGSSAAAGAARRGSSAPFVAACPFAAFDLQPSRPSRGRRQEDVTKVSIRHFLMLYSVNKTLFDAI